MEDIARTKIDILYKMVVEDVEALVSRIEQVAQSNAFEAQAQELRDLLDTVSAAAAAPAGDLAEAKKVLIAAQQTVAAVKASLDVLVLQAAGIGQTINRASIDYQHAAQLLHDAVNRAASAIDNPSTQTLVLKEKSIAAALLLVVAATSAIAGAAGGYLLAKPQNEFGQLNDLDAMMRCAGGVPETRPDGSRVCSVYPGLNVNSRVPAWKIK